MIIKKKKDISNYKYSLDYKNELFLLKKIIKIIKFKKIKPSADKITNIIKNDKELKKISDNNISKFNDNRKDLFS